MKVNGNKVKKITLLMALLAPMVYLFGTLFEALKGSNGTITLAQEQEEFVPSSTYEESVNASIAVNPYNVDYVYNESSFVPSNVLGNSIVKDGVLVDSQPSSFLSVGFNQWNELTRLNSDNRLVTYSPIPVLSDTSYYVFVGSNAYRRITWLDVDGAVISQSGWLQNSSFPKIAPSNAVALNVELFSDYGTTYNHDVCVNISNDSLNGTYKPYQYVDKVLDWPVLRSAGNVNDDVSFVNVGSIDLSTLTWNITNETYPRYFTNALASLIKAPSSASLAFNGLCSSYAIRSASETYNGNVGISVNTNGNIYVYPDNYSSFPSGFLNYELAYPVARSLSLPSSMNLFEGGAVYLKSNLVNEIQGEYKMYEGEYVLTPMSFSDYLFNQFFAEDNFLAASGRKLIDGEADYGFKPAADLIRFVDGNMFHLANVEYGALVIGYTYYAFHVVCVFLIFNLLMFFPHLIENIYEKFERGW